MKEVISKIIVSDEMIDGILKIMPEKAKRLKNNL